MAWRLYAFVSLVDLMFLHVHLQGRFGENGSKNDNGEDLRTYGDIPSTRLFVFTQILRVYMCTDSRCCFLTGTYLNIARLHRLLIVHTSLCLMNHN